MRRRGGSVASRLDALERSEGQRAVAVDPRRDEVGWLALFEAFGKDGRFDAEPDFPKALALYRNEIAQAQASGEWEPPASYKPDYYDQHLRVSLWRHERFPAVEVAGEWLTEILRRVAHDIPPVTEAEFAALARWFAVNEARLYRLSQSQPRGYFDMAGRAVDCASLRFDFKKGARVEGAGQVAEDVRQLRAKYGSAS